MPHYQQFVEQLDSTQENRAQPQTIRDLVNNIHGTFLSTVAEQTFLQMHTEVYHDKP